MADHHDHHHVPAGTDMRAAFTGLILGGIFVGGILFSVVKMTNAKYSGEKGHTEQTAQPAH